MLAEEVRRAIVPELLAMASGLDDCQRKFARRRRSWTIRFWAR